ncbi:hypothetical protein P3L51_10060 [Streptomyces sp. PSRA5]
MITVQTAAGRTYHVNPAGARAPVCRVATGTFTAGTATSLAMTVDDGTSLKVCSVALTPTGTTTTLGTVLNAAAGAATPSGCVTGVTPASGTGTITALNGKANAGGSTWRLSIDGASATTATRGTTINAGDTISLRYGS